MKDFLQTGRVERGLDFPSYLRLMERDLRTPLSEGMDETARSRLSTVPLNYQRATRIFRTCEAPAHVRECLSSVGAPQLWMVLSEPWCGDSAQSLPIIAKLAGCTPKITLRILLRDQNLDIMDLYRTAGTRGIPKLVAFGDEGTELFQWGPRPAGAQEEFLRAKAEGLGKAQVLERVHRWYAMDGGRAIQAEITELLRQSVGGVMPLPPDGSRIDRPQQR